MAHLPCRNGNSSEHNGIMYACASGFRCRPPPRAGSRSRRSGSSGPTASTRSPSAGSRRRQRSRPARSTTTSAASSRLYDFVREDVERRLLDRMEVRPRGRTRRRRIVLGRDGRPARRVSTSPSARASSGSRANAAGAEHDRLAAAGQGTARLSRLSRVPCCSLAGGVACGRRRCGPRRRTRRARRVRAPTSRSSRSDRCHLAGPFLPPRGVGDRFRT